MGMAVTRNKAEEFRRLAQECRATAQTLSTEQARAEMLAMADVCDRVAAQQTHGADLSEAGAPVGLGGFHSRIRSEDATAEKAVPFRCAVLDLFVR